MSCRKVSAAEIITDAGRASVRTLGTCQGPHDLPTERLGARLARWLGLPRAVGGTASLTRAGFGLC